VQHLAGAPADEAHERVVVAAGHAPLVGEGVAEHVRVQALDASAAPRLRITWAMPLSVMAPRPLSPSQSFSTLVRFWRARWRK